MQIIGSVFLLIMSGLLLWSSRPQGRAHWSGIASARFAAALIFLFQAIISLLPLTMPEGIRLLPQQLSLYAALPLLVSTLLIGALGFHWSRLIWGRILLALCVVFELMRRADELTLLLWISLIVAALAAVLSFTVHRKRALSALLSWLFLMLWFYLTGLSQSDLNLWLAATIIPCIYYHRAGTD